jgi:hypothetical protein
MIILVKGKQIMAETEWTSIISQVASLGINLLASVLSSDDKATRPFTQGDILWLKDGNDIKAYNTGDSEQGIAYAQSGLLYNNDNLPPSPYTRTDYKVLEGQSSYTATKDLEAFQEGSLCIGKVANTPSVVLDAPPSSIITFSIAFFAISIAVKIINGVELSVGKNSTTGLYTISLKTTGPQLQKAEVSVTDIVGDTVKAQATFTSPDAELGDSVYTLDLPPGINLDPIVGSLRLTLTVDTPSYIRATEESRRNLVKGLPEGIRTIR